MSSVNLTGTKQKTLQTLRQNSDLINTTSERLATGKRINKPQDGPNEFFVSSGINSRARDLESLLDGMTKARGHIESAEKGLEAIGKLLQSIESLLKGVTPEDDETRRNEVASQFNALIDQLESVARDAEFDGRNLLGGPGNTVSVYLNESSTAVMRLEPVNFTNAASANDLDLQDIAPGGLATGADVDAALAKVKTAQTTVQRAGKNFAMKFQSVEDRASFTDALKKALGGYSNDLVIADTNAEGARLLALQTRQQLASTSLSISNEADSYVLQLFG